MESDDERKAFEDYIAITFPEDKKRNRSAVIHRSLKQRITRYLKGNKCDKRFHTKCIECLKKKLATI